MAGAVEYMVLGRDTVDVDAGGGVRGESLDEALQTHGGAGVVQAILDELGRAGWDVVTLNWPYVFRRPAR